MLRDRVNAATLKRENILIINALILGRFWDCLLTKKRHFLTSILILTSLLAKDPYGCCLKLLFVFNDGTLGLI